MIDEFVTYLPCVLVLLTIFLVLISSIKDWYVTYTYSKMFKHDNALSVIVYVDSDFQSVEDTIRWIYGSTMHEIDIVVLNDMSGYGFDTSGKKRIIRSYPSTRFVQQRKPKPLSDTLAFAFKQSMKKEHIAVVKSSCYIHVGRKSFDSYLYSQNTLRHSRDTWVSTGYIGVMNTIKISVLRLLRSAFGSFNVHSDNRFVYGLIVNKSVYKNGKTLRLRFGDIDSQSTIKILNKSITIEMARVVIRLLLLTGTTIVTYVLIRSALYENDVMPLMNYWIAVCLVCLIVVLFNNQTIFKQKFDVILCISFVPILLVLLQSVSVKNVSIKVFNKN